MRCWRSGSWRWRCISSEWEGRYFEELPVLGLGGLGDSGSGVLLDFERGVLESTH